MRSLNFAPFLVFYLLFGGSLGCFLEYHLQNNAGTDTVVETQTESGSDGDTVSETQTASGSVGDTVSDTQTFIDDTDSKTDTISDTIPSGPMAILIGTESIGAHDTWNNPTNWDVEVVPSGTFAVTVSAGLEAQVDNDATPPYSGGLWLGANASLTIGASSAYAGNANALGTGPIIMREGSIIIARAGLGNYDFTQGIILEGDATIQAGISALNHGTSKTFSGGIRGAGRLIYNGVNGTWFLFNTSNPLWFGGFGTNDPQSQRHAVLAQADGCFGTGDVSINSNCTLVVDAGLIDAIDDAAVLTLSGAKADDQAAKLILNSSETVGALFLDGVPMPEGDYTNLVSWLSGTGTLTVRTTP